ncbi:MAG: LysR family transcriptional regulator [Acidaminococcus sp.]|jgi:DNA-binding transcriptional LysR family regulator|nr:LysR family transcriptional regulator [Acidaminococcus sp.]MCI2099670.1 LysR family transcriptional regulator [Acidaminococcus sp.]MCI2113925.1 LysR family transcriptional regulator [Acidaminococcus sp.]MCI2115838.1 LysR family transcriptional regulator [Acidaminococcus sp.]
MQADDKYILEIYRKGTLSAAADALYMTSPALCISLHKIEKRLGVPLFTRTPHKMIPTEAGKEYIGMLEDIEMRERNFTRYLEDVKHLETGELIIGGTHYINAYILPDVLTRYSQQYPHIRITIYEKSAKHLEEDLLKQKIDVTLSCDEKIVHTIKSSPAFTDHILIGVPQEHPINNELHPFALSAGDIAAGRHMEDDCPSLPISRFKDLEFIMLSEGNNLHDRAYELFHQAELNPKVKLEISQMITALHLAEHGFAATFISDRSISPHCPLRFYKIDSDIAVRQFYLITGTKPYLPFALRRFMDFFPLSSKMS